MIRLIEALAVHAAERPAATAIESDDQRLGYGALDREVRGLAAGLDGACTALLLDNGPAWAVLDLALLRAGIPCVPLPPFFSRQQIAHALRDAGVDTVFTDAPGRLADQPGVARDGEVRVAGRTVARLRLPRRAGAPDLAGLAKVTYTSGTTAEPRGVCLGAEHIESVARSLCEAIGAGRADSALALLPLSTLLENIGGLYAPLLAGARSTLLPLERVGMRGATGVDVPVMLAALARFEPTTVILVPELLQVLTGAAEAGWTPPASLRFVAVGGAPVSPRLLSRAERVGLPVYEGYGLSEAASVVTLNRRGAHRPGSVGRPLDHARVRIAGNGEVLVAGCLFEGYLGERRRARGGWWHTGDLGHLDDDGYLHLTGRSRNVFITAYGRNVAPEWVESELVADGTIAQAMLIGEGRPFNVAVLVPASARAAGRVPEVVARVNADLPDYARAARFIVADTPFSVANGQLTPGGRLCRRAIAHHHDARIQDFYGECSA